MRKLRVRKKLFVKLFIAAILSIIFLYCENNWIDVEKINLSFKNLPKGFDGFKIVQISDLHNKRFGKDQNTLINDIKNLKPDIIVITGDIVDSRNYDEKPVIEFVNKVTKIANTFYVTGNHEWWERRRFYKLESKMKYAGVVLLNNNSQNISRKGNEITLMGINDPGRDTSVNEERNTINNNISIAKKTIEKGRHNNFIMLLSHRPETFKDYVDNKIDLTFSGHAHGGQFRIPFVGGLIAPNQGLFPKYTSGAYKNKGEIMVVSRGLGNSIIPQRIFNRPEIIEVILHKK